MATPLEEPGIVSEIRKDGKVAMSEEDDFGMEHDEDDEEDEDEDDEEEYTTYMSVYEDDEYDYEYGDYYPFYSLPSKKPLPLANVVNSQSSWALIHETIEVRVTNKGWIHPCTNRQKTVLQLHVIDAEGTQAEVVAWDAAADKLDASVECDKVYRMKSFRLTETKEYSYLVENPWQVIISEGSHISCSQEELPHAMITYTKLHKLRDLHYDEFYHVIGVVTHFQERAAGVCRVKLLDETSETFVDVYDFSTSPLNGVPTGSIVSFHFMRYRPGYPSLRTLNCTMILVEPQCELSNPLRTWYVVQFAQQARDGL